MRDDDDNSRLYMPVFWRIIILVAVIAAVPVMLWTITAFMRTYVAQPRLPTFKPIAEASSTVTPVGSPAADPNAPTVVAASAGAPDATADDGRGPLLGDRIGSDSTGSIPSMNANMNARVASASPQAPAPTAASPWPEPQLATAAADPTFADLPPGKPLTGRIPLPPRRPHFAAAEAPSAPMPHAVPMPRARPATAPEAKSSNPDDAPFSRSRLDSMQ